MTRSAGLPSLEEILDGHPIALGRAITAAEREDPAFAGVLAETRARAGRAFRVGLAGPPGAGKSSLLREIIRRLRETGDRAALIACDPVSPATGGAFLGDRCRLVSLSRDPGVFIRSLAHRSRPGEPGPAALLALDILDAAGYPWVFLETVGTGQADVDALRGTALKVLVHAPDSGDWIQMLKAGAIETADLHVVNKCDRPLAEAWAKELAGSMSPPGGPEGPPSVFAASAVTGEGVDALVAELRRRRNARRDVAGDRLTS